MKRTSVVTAEMRQKRRKREVFFICMLHSLW
jgi:hypothetical protein